MKDTSYARSLVRSENKVRGLTSRQVGLAATDDDNTESPLPCVINDDDPHLKAVRGLLDNDGYAGVIFVGPPGTSKTWYAHQIAAKLVDLDRGRVRFVQFHSSYQYEDFVEGYVPLESGGFRSSEKHFLDMCRVAADAVGKRCVMVIDEISRCDPARVFGEALTYIEMTMRDRPFCLASGRRVSIPRNLVILATMNQMDRGVSEVDGALERRFAKISMDPDILLLEKMLVESNMPAELRARVVRFFQQVQGNANRNSAVGHAYFRGISDAGGLQRLWDHQLKFHFQKAFVLDPDGFSLLERDWNRNVLPQPVNAAPATSGNEAGDGNEPQARSEQPATP